MITKKKMKKIFLQTFGIKIEIKKKQKKEHNIVK